uniref:Uncharacterized protein n=1 Tax=Romanomermis culicivorax TaxID=13658 RepID=A0A915KPY5_ROMCU
MAIVAGVFEEFVMICKKDTVVQEQLILIHRFNVTTRFCEALYFNQLDVTAEMAITEPGHGNTGDTQMIIIDGCFETSTMINGECCELYDDCDERGLPLH